MSYDVNIQLAESQTDGGAVCNPSLPPSAVNSKEGLTTKSTNEEPKTTIVSQGEIDIIM